MTAPADLICKSGAIYQFGDDELGPEPDPDGTALAIRDGDVVRVGSDAQVGLLEGVETTLFDLDGSVVLPGFVDAHTHLAFLGQRQREADLGEAASREECLDLLRTRREETADGWVVGFGYDESTWESGTTAGAGGEGDAADATYLTREDLDGISEDRPVAAFREDMHLASVNSVVLESHRDALPDAEVRTASGDPTGVIVEDAVGIIMDELRPESEGLRKDLLAAQAYAHRHGVTGVHDMVTLVTARAYRDLELAGELSLRVRLNYYDDHLDGVREAGLATDHGSNFVEMGAIKAFMDGSIGGRTARVSEPYRDGDSQGDGTETATDATATDDDGYGEWVTTPAELADLADEVEAAGLQLAVHAIGDLAIEAAVYVLDGRAGGPHRIEHAEILPETVFERLVDSDSVVSGQPNFLKWARDGGLYDERLGTDRRKESNRFGDLAGAGVPLAFGSDCMPLGPLFGIEQVVTAPAAGQQLSVTEALDGYTRGAAQAPTASEEFGTLEVGTAADIVVLGDSPWAVADDDIGAIEVEATIVDGNLVYDGRETA